MHHATIQDLIAAAIDAQQADDGEYIRRLSDVTEPAEIDLETIAE